MQTYDPSPTPTRRHAGAHAIPGMRPAYEAERPVSATPIYDSLCAEYRRLFRTLPGDRTGEEDMKFTGFGLRRSYGSRDAERQLPDPPASGTGYGGAGAAGSPFAQGHQYGGGWTPVGHIPPSTGRGGRHRGMLSLPPGRAGGPA